MRHRFLDIDDRLEELSYYQRQNPQQWLSFQQMYEMSWIYHENILDGVALTPEEIKEALSSDLTRDISLVSIFRRIRNYKKCIDFVRDKAVSDDPRVDVEAIKELHSILVAGSDITPGKYRRNSPVHRAYYQQICAPGRVPYHLGQIVDYINAGIGNSHMHPLEHAAHVHHRFMHAYPFSSISGVVGRFLVNMILMRHQMIPIVIHCQERQKYYHAIATSPELVTRVFIESFENNIENAFHHFVEQHCHPQHLATIG